MLGDVVVIGVGDGVESDEVGGDGLECLGVGEGDECVFLPVKNVKMLGAVAGELADGLFVIEAVADEEADGQVRDAFCHGGELGEGAEDDAFGDVEFVGGDEGGGGAEAVAVHAPVFSRGVEGGRKGVLEGLREGLEAAFEAVERGFPLIFREAGEVDKDECLIGGELLHVAEPVERNSALPREDEPDVGGLVGA